MSSLNKKSGKIKSTNAKLINRQTGEQNVRNEQGKKKRTKMTRNLRTRTKTEGQNQQIFCLQTDRKNKIKQTKKELEKDTMLTDKKKDRGQNKNKKLYLEAK